MAVDACERAAALESEVALLKDKLANAEDEYAALYAKALKSETREQERVARHHKAVGQLQKKVLAEAEIKRQLQRKLDGKEAPLAALGEKEAVWAVERDAMQTQLRALEDQRRQVGEELERKDAHLQRLETSLIDMNMSMQELEKSAAHWKSTAEKHKAQVLEAVAAQRSSDSRVVVLQAENVRRRDENKALREHLPVPTPSADMQTQTEHGLPVGAPESRRREGEEWAYLMQMLMQTCADASLAVHSARELGSALLAEGYPQIPATREVTCADASVGTEARAVRHVAVETDSARHSQNVHVQTEEMGNIRADAGVQTVPEPRATRYHVDTQTDPEDKAKRAHAEIQTNDMVFATREHTDAAARKLVDMERESAEHTAQKRGLENELRIARETQQSQVEKICALEGELESQRAATNQQVGAHRAHKEQARKELAVLEHELADHAMRRQILEDELNVAGQARQKQENQIRVLTKELETMSVAVRQQRSTPSPTQVHVATATSPRASPRTQVLEDELESAGRTQHKQEQQIRVLTEELENMEAAAKQQKSKSSEARCDVATSTSPPTSPQSHSAAAGDSRPEEQVIPSVGSTQSTRPALEVPATTRIDVEHRDERWWRRSPLKATSSAFSPDTARSAGTPSENVHAVPLKMDVPGLEKEGDRRAEVATVAGGGGGGWTAKPVSPDAMGSGTPHPQPGVRRFFAGTPSSMRGLVPPAPVQLPWPLGKQQGGGGVNALSSAAMREASLNRPLFRANEGPLQVRLPTSPGPSVHGAEELKRTPIAILQQELELEKTQSTDTPLVQRVADQVVPVANIPSSDRLENGLGAEASTSASVRACAQEVALPDASHNPASGTQMGQVDIDDMVRIHTTLPVEHVEAPAPDSVDVQHDQARVQSSIAVLHSIESALLAGRTDRVIPGSQEANVVAEQQLRSEDPENPPAVEPEALPAEESAAVPMATTIRAVPVTVAGVDGQHTLQSRVLGTGRLAAKPDEVAEAPGPCNQQVIDMKDGRQNAKAQLENSQAQTLPSHFCAHTPKHHIRLIAEEAEDPALVNDLDFDARSIRSLSHASRTPSTPSPSGSIPAEHGDDEQASGVQGKTIITDAKWLFGSPRDAVSLLTDSPHGSLRIRAATSMPLMGPQPAELSAESRAGPRMVQESTKAPRAAAPRESTPDSDSSDDETWNGFVKRGVRPRLHRSLLDEAAGLKKTLTHALANDVASTARSSHIGMGSANDQSTFNGEGLGSEHQMQSLQRRLQGPRLASSGGGSISSLDSADAQYDLNGLLDEVRRATDRCERRKRMIKLLDGKSSDQEQPAGMDQEKLVPRQDVAPVHAARASPWSRRKGARSIQDTRDWRHDPDHSRDGRVHRRKNVLNHRFGEVRPAWVSPSSGTDFVTPDHDRGGGLRRPGRTEQSLLAARTASPKRNEILQMMAGSSGDTGVRWSPIKPSQMAVLRSFLTNLDDSPI